MKGKKSFEVGLASSTKDCEEPTLVYRTIYEPKFHYQFAKTVSHFGLGLSNATKLLCVSLALPSKTYSRNYWPCINLLMVEPLQFNTFTVKTKHKITIVCVPFF